MLKQSATPLGDVNIFGAGRVDALAAANLVVASNSGVAAAVLPASRSVPIQVAATVFAAIALSPDRSGTSCGISLATNIPATLSYQITDRATNQPTGTPNTPVNIAADDYQTFIISITPSAPFPPTDVAFNFSCANLGSATVLSGLNTLLLSASTTPTPDIVALAATPGNTGIVKIAGVSGAGIFAVATVNAGASGQITVSADTGAANLPLTIALCQTNPTTSVCLGPLGPTVTTQINAGQTPTFAIFVQGMGNAIALDPGYNRINVRFKDAGGATRGATSVAVQTE